VGLTKNGCWARTPTDLVWSGSCRHHQLLRAQRLVNGGMPSPMGRS